MCLTLQSGGPAFPSKPDALSIISKYTERSLPLWGAHVAQWVSHPRQDAAGFVVQGELAVDTAGEKCERPLPESQGAALQGLGPSGQVLPRGKSEQGSRPGVWGRSVCSLLRVPPSEVVQLLLDSE